jgi:hypothetical protein
LVLCRRNHVKQNLDFCVVPNSRESGKQKIKGIPCKHDMSSHKVFSIYLQFCYKIIIFYQSPAKILEHKN